MTGAELLAWRTAKGWTQKDCAEKINVSARTWRMYEQGDLNVPPYVESYALNHPAIASEAKDSDGNEMIGAPGFERPWTLADKPRNEAEIILNALASADAWMTAFDEFVVKYGTDAPQAFAESFWYEGAERHAILYYGERGALPSRKAYELYMKKIRAYFDTGAVWRVFAQLDDCPLQIKEYAQALPPDLDGWTPGHHAEISPSFWTKDPARDLERLRRQWLWLVEHGHPAKSATALWSILTARVADHWAAYEEVSKWIRQHPAPTLSTYLHKNLLEEGPQVARSLGEGPWDGVKAA